jgi:squalene-hopene/tetraprenyl-beta-curcumene cyclase
MARSFVSLGLLVLLLLGVTGGAPLTQPTTSPPSSQPVPDSDLRGRIDVSLTRAIRYLVSRQSADGAWRSGKYGFFRDGPTLTPHVMSGLCDVIPAGSLDEGPIVKGADYLASLVDAEGNLRHGEELNYPVYIAADASRVVTRASRVSERRTAQSAWLACLRRYQLTEALGWHPQDIEYGGWGYAHQPPRKTPGGSTHGPMDCPNLTATLFALEALRAAGVSAEDPACRQALIFVQRCQNYAEAPTAANRSFQDGGFFFSPCMAMRNKAGATVDANGREWFNSYGSMTADGFRALLDCGLPRDHPLVRQAGAWLGGNFSADRNPGRFIAANAGLCQSTYYYYAWSVSRALPKLDRKTIPASRVTPSWPVALAEELLKRQRPNGSWANDYSDGKEDEPLVATPLAVSALEACRESLE